jgi:hypothetical protein
MYVSIAIPIIIVGYLLIANLVLTTSKEYSIQEFTPEERFEQTDILTINQNLVYFNVPAKGADKISLEIELNSEDDVKLGARNAEEWSYLYKPLLLKDLDLSNYEKTDDGYQITSNDYVIATDKDIKPLPNYPEGFESELTTFTTQLRGGHTFLLYAENSLYLKISKTDLNWYEGKDSPLVTIKQYDTIVKNGTIPDDGEVNKSEPSVTEEFIEFDIPITRGVYEIEVEDFDGIITQIQTNTNKLVVQDKLFLADAELYLGYNPASIYFNPKKEMTVEIYTYHDSGIQVIDINGKASQISERNTKYNRIITEQTTITPEKNNLIFEYNGYASLTEDSYFNPFQNIIVPLTYNLNFVDKIITDYNQPIRKGDYYLTNVTFDLVEDNLTLINDELSLVFNIEEITTIKSVKATVINEGLI